MKKYLFACILCLTVTGTGAQSLWTSAEMKFGIVGNLSGNVEGEYRTNDGMSATERWTASAGLDYKLCKWLKLSADYKLIYRHIDSRTTKKGNIVSDYWSVRHRAGLSLTGSYRLNRLTLSLRERYQYTYRGEQSVAKWDGDDGTAKSDEIIESKSKHVLRSRLKVEYNIRKSHFTPFASCEFYNSLSDFTHDKVRYTIGTDYKINKKHSLNAFYRYVDTSDDDESDGHVIGIGYKFKL